MPVIQSYLIENQIDFYMNCHYAKPQLCWDNCENWKLESV